MTTPEDIVRKSLQAREKLHSEVKSDSDQMLSGFTLTSLSNLSSQLQEAAQQFVSERSYMIDEAGKQGQKMAKDLQGLSQ